MDIFVSHGGVMILQGGFVILFFREKLNWLNLAKLKFDSLSNTETAYLVSSYLQPALCSSETPK